MDILAFIWHTCPKTQTDSLFAGIIVALLYNEAQEALKWDRGRREGGRAPRFGQDECFCSGTAPEQGTSVMHALSFCCQNHRPAHSLSSAALECWRIEGLGENNNNKISEPKKQIFVLSLTLGQEVKNYTKLSVMQQVRRIRASGLGSLKTRSVSILSIVQSGCVGGAGDGLFLSSP